MELYKGLLDRVPLFKGVEDIFVRQLVKFVTLDFYMPDEYIIRKDDVGKEMFFIQRGVCHVLADDELTPLFTLPTGSFFGEIALVLSERRSASVAAGTACDILVLHRRDLFSTLNDYPAVATLLHDFARQRLAERNIAEEEKLKADAIRERMSEMGAPGAPGGGDGGGGRMSCSGGGGGRMSCSGGGGGDVRRASSAFGGGGGGGGGGVGRRRRRRRGCGQEAARARGRGLRGAAAQLVRRLRAARLVVGRAGRARPPPPIQLAVKPDCTRPGRPRP